MLLFCYYWVFQLSPDWYCHQRCLCSMTRAVIRQRLWGAFTSVSSTVRTSVDVVQLHWVCLSLSLQISQKKLKKYEKEYDSMREQQEQQEAPIERYEVRTLNQFINQCVRLFTCFQSFYYIDFSYLLPREMVITEHFSDPGSPVCL